jgi:hypothetical protein
MKILPRPSPGRVAVLVMLGALVLTVSALLYLFLLRMLRPVELQPSAADPVLALRRKLTLLLLIVLGACLLILVFAIGAYLVLRIGRAVARRQLGGTPTEYVDAWSHYRLSEQDIASATREERRRPRGPDERDDGGPASDNPESPDAQGG